MPIKPQPPACAACPAQRAGALSFVPPRGPADASLLVLGQGPGETEAHLGQPFVGRAGQRLGVWLRLAGIAPERVRFANAVQCWLQGPVNRAPRPAESAHCRITHWGAELARPSLRAIVACGVPAMRALFGTATEATAGSWRLVRVGDCDLPVVGVLHPAAILRGRWGDEPKQVEAMRAVARVLAGEPPPVWDFSRPRTGALHFPTLAQLCEWRAQCQPGDEVALDVEAAGRVLRMVGLCRVRDLAYAAVWFRTRGGAVWPHPSFPAVVEWLFDVLADPALGKVMHNGFYDIEQLEETGFEVRGVTYDTLLAAHIACPEVRKRLESVSYLCGGPTGWKALLTATEGDLK